MNGSIRCKLMISYLFLVLFLATGLYGYLLLNLESCMPGGTREHLQDEARVASLMASKEIRDLRSDAPALTDSLAKAIRSRVTVIAPDGVVVADSEVPAADLAKLE